MGFKATAGFKATDKSGGNAAIAAIKNLGANLVSAMNGTGTSTAAPEDSLPVSQLPVLAAAAHPKPVAPPKVIIGPNGQRIVQRPMTQAEVLQVRVGLGVRGVGLVCVRVCAAGRFAAPCLSSWLCTLASRLLVAQQLYVHAGTARQNVCPDLP